MWEMHFSIDGTKYWCKIKANSEREAKQKLFSMYPNRYVVVIWIS